MAFCRFCRTSARQMRATIAMLRAFGTADAAPGHDDEAMTVDQARELFRRVR